jgi:hypothetical protein
MQSLARANAFVTAAVIASAALLPAVLLSSSASGAQLSNRFIDMSGGQTSEGSGRDGGDAFGDDVTYRVGFTIATTNDIEAVVIDFCGDSPITGDPCNVSEDLVNTYNFDTNFASLGLANQSGITDFTVDTTNSTANKLILSRSGGAASVSASTAVAVDLGSTGAADGITNPNDEITFFARIFTFATDAAAISYTSTSPGSFVDDGGIALATANELTITARVQEVLEFCIGTEGDSAYTNVQGDSCADVAGTDLSLGVVDSNSIATTENIDVPNNGVAMIRTNAVNGASIYYKAEQDTSSGQLKIAGEACNGTNLDDPCFNSVGASRTPIVASTEDFGMALKERTTSSGGATDSVTCATNYQGDATAGCTGAVAGNNYAWVDSGAFTTIASSTGPVDDEKMLIEFAATASPTTPTGLYTVTANFVATSTF